MTKKKWGYINLTIRILLGLLFLVSGIGKLINGSDARYLVELLATKYFWLIEYAHPIVLTVSIIEVLLSILLLWGKYLKTALAGSLVMVSCFTAVLGYFYAQGMSIANCGCFGAFGFSSGLEFTLVRNAVLLVMIIAGLIISFVADRN